MWRLALSFKERNKDKAVRRLEATRQCQESGFNKPVVNKLFDKQLVVYRRIGVKLKPDNIWNVDETSTPTVLAPPKVLPSIGQKQVAQTTSAERGQTMTMMGFVNAGGGTIPSVFVFPRVHFAPHMTPGAPPGTPGLAHQVNG